MAKMEGGDGDDEDSFEEGAAWVPNGKTKESTLKQRKECGSPKDWQTGWVALNRRWRWLGDRRCCCSLLARSDDGEKPITLHVMESGQMRASSNIEDLKGHFAAQQVQAIRERWAAAKPYLPTKKLQ